MSLNFEIYFLEFQLEIVFGVISHNYLYLNTLNYSGQYNVFDHKELKLLDLLSDCVLIRMPLSGV